jgi:hypothetical protein
VDAKLHRFWFVGTPENPYGVAGIGVTAFTEDDAGAMLIQTWSEFAGGRFSPWQSWTLSGGAGPRSVLRPLPQGGARDVRRQGWEVRASDDESDRAWLSGDVAVLYPTREPLRGERTPGAGS